MLESKNLWSGNIVLSFRNKILHSGGGVGPCGRIELPACPIRSVPAVDAGAE